MSDEQLKTTEEKEKIDVDRATACISRLNAVLEEFHCHYVVIFTVDSIGNQSFLVRAETNKP